MNIVILGAPGSGKGYVSDYLKSKHNFKHISTGEILRENIKNKTSTGIIAEKYISSGSLVPSEIINKMMSDILDKNSNNLILDGYPRTIEQAEYLNTLTNVHLVLYIDVPEEIIVSRVSKRLICTGCGKTYTSDDGYSFCPICNCELKQRADDKKDVVIQRLQIFNQTTKPLIDYYVNKQILVTVDNSGDLNKTYEQIENILKSIK